MNTGQLSFHFSDDEWFSHVEAADARRVNEELTLTYVMANVANQPTDDEKIYSALIDLGTATDQLSFNFGFGHNSAEVNFSSPSAVSPSKKICPHCNKGKVELLTSTRDCDRCGGTGEE